MKEEYITAWVTKYALTQGIEMVDGHVCHSVNSAMLEYNIPGYRSCYAHGKEWHRTPEAAIARAEEMRTAKILSLKKQIAKIESLNFESDKK